MTPTDIDALMARIYRHYPRGIPKEDPRHRETEETKRLRCVMQACAESRGRTFPPIDPRDRAPLDKEVEEVVNALRAWLPFQETLQRVFPDSIVGDPSVPWQDPSCWCDVSQPGYIPGSNAADDPVVCAASMLAPVYMLFIYVPVPGGWTRVRYSQFPSQYQDRAAKMVTLMEETFHFSRLTEETLLLPVLHVVPGVSNLALGEATLLDCLFTSHLPLAVSQVSANIPGQPG